LALSGLAGAAASAVSPIPNDPRFKSLVQGSSSDNGQIGALDGVSAKLQAQVALCRNRPREDHEAARFLVEPVDGANGRMTATLLPRDESR
jgi:hypothetical protein